MHLKILIQVQPGAICTLFVIFSIENVPLSLVGLEDNVSLILGQKLVVNLDVARGSSAYHDLLSVFASRLLLVVVYLAS